MTKNILIRMRNILVLIAVQVLIFSRIHLFGYATACVYLIFLLKLPRHTKSTGLLIWGFFSGLIIDMFCNTPGIHAAATTAMCFARNPILAAFTHKGMPDDFVPGIKSIKWGGYLVYSALCLLIFYVVLFLLELFTMSYPSILITCILSSVLLTMLIVIVIEFFTSKRQ